VLETVNKTLIASFDCLLDNSPTNQLAVSQVVDWSTCGLVNSPTANFFFSRKDYNVYPKQKPTTLTLTLSTFENVQ